MKSDHDNTRNMKKLKSEARELKALKAWEAHNHSLDAVMMEVQCGEKAARELVYNAQRKAMALEMSGYTAEDWMQSQQADYMMLKKKLQNLLNVVETDILDTKSEDGEHVFDPSMMLRVIDRMTNLLKAMDSSLEKQGLFQKKVQYSITHDAILGSEEGQNFMQTIMDYLRGLVCPYCGRTGLCDPRDILEYQQRRAKMMGAQFVDVDVDVDVDVSEDEETVGEEEEDD